MRKEEFSWKDTGTAVTNHDACGVYVYPLCMNDVVTNMSLEQRAKWISDLSGIPYERMVGLLKTSVNLED